MHRFMSASALSAIMFVAAAIAAPGDSVVVQAEAPTASGSYTAVAGKVAYGDLDVTTAEGAKALQGRIDAAARTLCGTPKSWENADPYEKCRKRAVDRAVRSIDSPELTRIAGNP